MADRAHLVRLTKQLADDGKLLESGWIGMRLACIPDNAPVEQLRSMRLAYMAGAQHAFSSMMNMMDEGQEPTEADMAKMDLLHKEIQAFTGELEAWAKEGKG